MVQDGPERAPQLIVTARGARVGAGTREILISTLDKMLGLNVNLNPFRRMAEGDQRLAGLVDPFIGFKPPRLHSVFETLINGVACQQLSLQVGMHLLNRLCRAYGLTVGEHHAFPRPMDIASGSPTQLRRLGFSGSKSLVILKVARAIVDGSLNLEELAALTTADARDRLLALKGIGRWTAQYILLRGLSRLDVFPADDVGSRNKMQQWLRRKRARLRRNVPNPGSVAAVPRSALLLPALGSPSPAGVARTGASAPLTTRSSSGRWEAIRIPTSSATGSPSEKAFEQPDGLSRDQQLQLPLAEEHAAAPDAPVHRDVFHGDFGHFRPAQRAPHLADRWILALRNDFSPSLGQRVRILLMKVSVFPVVSAVGNTLLRHDNLRIKITIQKHRRTLDVIRGPRDVHGSGSLQLLLPPARFAPGAEPQLAGPTAAGGATQDAYEKRAATEREGSTHSDHHQPPQFIVCLTSF